MDKLLDRRQFYSNNTKGLEKKLILQSFGAAG
jgi:hypothetical protein